MGPCLDFSSILLVQAEMDEAERKFLADLPDQFVVYRGHQIRNRMGYSWTLSYYRAKWFSQRFQNKKIGVVSAIIRKEEVVALLLGRNEFEVICNPNNLLDVRTIPKIKKRPAWIENVVEHATANFKLKNSTQSFHGPFHWEKVEKNGDFISKATPGCDPLIVKLFAIIHDSKRENEDHDPEHGQRAATFAKLLFDKKELKISESQLKILMEACEGHDGGLTSLDPTIGACWDADRLDLTRVGIIPNPNLLSTQTGKNLLWKI